MKVILLATGRGLRLEYINQTRGNLGLRDSDVVCLASWHRPRNPLPVNRHLVIGPHLRLKGDLATVQRVQRTPALFPPAVERLAVETPTDPASPDPASPDPASPDPASPDPASPDPTSPDPTSPDPTNPGPRKSTTAHLPLLHPRRMRKAVTWRIRRLRKTARTQAASRLAGARAHPGFRKVRNRLAPSVSIGFAASCLRAGKVHDMVRDADLVVALDAASQRGAWTLAKKVPGPHVVIGIPAAKRIIEQHQESAEKSSPS